MQRKMSSGLKENISSNYLWGKAYNFRITKLWEENSFRTILKATHYQKELGKLQECADWKGYCIGPDHSFTLKSHFLSFWFLLVSFVSWDRNRVQSGMIFLQCGDKTLLDTLTDARRVTEFFSLALRSEHYSQPHVRDKYCSLWSFQMGLSPPMCSFFIHVCGFLLF